MAGETQAELMLYRLRIVTVANQRFELISAFNPENYTANYGGNLVIRRVYVIRQWLEKKTLNPDRWKAILIKEKLYPTNYLRLPDLTQVEGKD